MKRSHTILVLAALSVVLTAIIYGAGVSLPFYSDDLAQIPWVKDTSLAQIWRSVNPYDHYRPVQFSIWRIWYVVSGDLQPVVLHTLNLFFHALCAFLTGLLALRLWRERWWAALLATALVAAFPLAFDSILWVSSFAYPLATSLGLITMLIFLQAEESGLKRWHWLGLLVTVLAGLALESAVVVGVVILLTAVLLRRQKSWRWPLLYLVGSIIPLLLLIYFSRVPANDFLISRVIQNVEMVLQMTIFPVATVVKVLVPDSGNPGLLVALVAAVILLILALAAWRGGWWLLFLFALGWIMLWAAIPAITQTYDWQRDPSRAFYPAVVGISLLWTAVIVYVAGFVRSRQSRGLLVTAVAMAILLPAVWFSIGRTRLYSLAGDLLWEVIDLEEAPSLIVNLPERLTPEQHFYPIGFEGVIPMPPPTDDVDLLRQAHNQPPLGAGLRSAGPVLPELSYKIAPVGATISPADLEESETTIVAAYADKSAGLLTVGGVISANQDHTALVAFDQEIELLSSSCRLGGDVAIIELTWQINTTLEETTTVFVHLSQGGVVVAQADGAPLAGLYPFSAWRIGQIVSEQRYIPLPESEGEVQVGVGVYDGTSGERLPALVDGARLPEDVSLMSCPTR